VRSIHFHFYDKYIISRFSRFSQSCMGNTLWLTFRYRMVGIYSW